MKVGIIIYSQTGNTRTVAAKLRDKLQGAGHSVALEEVKLAGERKPGTRDVQPGPLPDPAPYDLVVIGSPVEAFSLSPVMTAALRQIRNLDKKRVLCLITQGFPFAWLGGNRAARQMRKLCEAQGAAVRGAAVVNWMGKGLDRRITDAVDKLAGLV